MLRQAGLGYLGMCVHVCVCACVLRTHLPAEAGLWASCGRLGIAPVPRPAGWAAWAGCACGCVHACACVRACVSMCVCVLQAKVYLLRLASEQAVADWAGLLCPDLHGWAAWVLLACPVAAARPRSILGWSEVLGAWDPEAATVPACISP